MFRGSLEWSVKPQQGKKNIHTKRYSEWRVRIQVVSEGNPSWGEDGRNDGRLVTQWQIKQINKYKKHIRSEGSHYWIRELQTQKEKKKYNKTELELYTWV